LEQVTHNDQYYKIAFPDSTKNKEKIVRRQIKASIADFNQPYLAKNKKKQLINHQVTRPIIKIKDEE